MRCVAVLTDLNLRRLLSGYEADATLPGCLQPRCRPKSHYRSIKDIFFLHLSNFQYFLVSSKQIDFNTYSLTSLHYLSLLIL